MIISPIFYMGNKKKLIKKGLIDLFPKNKEYYTSLNKTIIEAINELKKYMTIQYEQNKKDNVYQPDAWYITPNGYLYNVGKK